MQQDHSILGAKATACLATALLATPAIGDIVFSDGFDDGTREPFTIANGSSSSSSPNVTVIDDSAGIGSGNAMRVEGNGTTSFRRMALGFDTISLASAGDFIAFSFDARHNGTAPDSDRDLRFGLYNQGALLTDDDFDGNSTFDTLSDDVGYYIQVDTGVGAGTTADLRLEFNTDGNPLTGSESTGDSESIGGQTSDPLASLTDVARSYKLTLTLQDPADPKGLLLELDVNGTNLISRSLNDSSEAIDVITTLDFNGFLISQNGTELDYIIDNVVIETNVPEPAAMGLASIGGLALLRRIRK